MSDLRSADIRALLGVLDDEEIARARAGAALVVERGFSREKDLPKLLEEALRDRTMPVAGG